MAPSSFLSAVASQSTSSTGLPLPSGSALVSHGPSATSRLHCTSFTLSLCPSGSVGLLVPSSSTLVLCHSGFTAAFWIPTCASVALTISSTLALRIFSITLALQLFISALGFITTGSATYSRLPGVVSPFSTMASPSIGSTRGRLPGWALECLE
ncbi:Nuclear factor of activated T-cells, cytoplasmic 3 [Labeo rohita]|uniref:Nuclear factor of activated T-cells, cytoplasmic 3 n=1 Tax=Labeo rohita TaxID=84645 RepID=A0ABQ8MHL9_LABRO|nr:Nuclear factor of activated T-cells, cytoplasmic 3 [Labeo rohita]